jgi:hypothetical protein
VIAPTQLACGFAGGPADAGAAAARSIAAVLAIATSARRASCVPRRTVIVPPSRLWSDRVAHDDRR